jgi:hypothetical protein
MLGAQRLLHGPCLKKHKNLKWAKIGPIILGAPYHVRATMDLGPTWHVPYDTFVLRIYTHH